MLIKKGISFLPEQVNMKIVEVGDGQKCSSCGEPLKPFDAKDGVIICKCGQKNEISLESPNGK